MRQAAWVFLVLSAIAASAVAQEAGPPVDPPSVVLPADLAKVLRDYESAWTRRDAARLASLFAEDGFVLPNGSPPSRGRAAIERFYQTHGGPLSLRALAYATSGDVGYVIGAYASHAGAADDGKFTLTLRRQASGQWLIVSDMDNSNRKRE